MEPLGEIGGVPAETPPVGARRVAGPPPAPRWPATVVFFGAVLLSMAVGTVAIRVWEPVTVTLAIFALVALLLGRTRTRPVAMLFGWLAPPAGLLVLLLWMSGAIGDYFLSRRFDREAWLAVPTNEHRDRTRLRMVDDLRASGRLDRITREEARTLLGEPDMENRGAGDSSWVWWIGPDSGIGIDSSWLRLQFGEDGRVVAHSVVED